MGISLRSGLIIISLKIIIKSLYHSDGLYKSSKAIFKGRLCFDLADQVSLLQNFNLNLRSINDRRKYSNGTDKDERLS